MYFIKKHKAPLSGIHERLQKSKKPKHSQPKPRQALKHNLQQYNKSQNHPSN